MDYTPPTETDGPPGAIAVAQACIANGQTVYILTDKVGGHVVGGLTTPTAGEESKVRSDE